MKKPGFVTQYGPPELPPVTVRKRPRVGDKSMGPKPKAAAKPITENAWVVTEHHRGAKKGI